jgi:hypothetical protein
MSCCFFMKSSVCFLTLAIFSSSFGATLGSFVIWLRFDRFNSGLSTDSSSPVTVLYGIRSSPVTVLWGVLNSPVTVRWGKYEPVEVGYLKPVIVDFCYSFGIERVVFLIGKRGSAASTGSPWVCRLAIGKNGRCASYFGENSSSLGLTDDDIVTGMSSC